MDTGRLTSLGIGGWKVLVLTATRTGRIAEKIESEALKTIIESGARLGHVPKDQMPYGGHTETIDQDSIRKSQLISIFKSTSARMSK
jgi:predicted nuclease with TOPRIM domain